MNKKELLINTVRMIDIDGSTNIPTVLFYVPDDKVLTGSSALAAATNRRQVNEDFKIDLGNHEPKSARLGRRFTTATGTKKLAVELTADFLYQLLLHVRDWLSNNDIVESTNIMLAEPLAMQTDSAPVDWLSNYRKNLRGLVIGKGFEKIDFLPEPFAVFQYYRYGLRHPIVAERTKHIALVIDFGGGTFDVCIIESTKEGDISQTGRNSRPYGSSSNPVGGFYINRMIAEELFRKYAPPLKESKTKKGLDLYKNWQKDLQDLSTTADEYQNFVRNFHEAIYEVENLKLTLCKSITNWGLDAPLTLTAPIAIPKDPFSTASGFTNVQFSATELRNAFIGKVWEQRLKSIIRIALQRGKEELSGAPISVVLLSGGSANIGWLRELLQRAFASELSNAEILRLPDFQEVVAKGLAVECARRFYNQEGDFSSVTYNRLCLILDPDGSECKVRPFRPRTEGLPNVADMPGVLLPSASVLRSFIEKPMRWKVKLEHPPRKRLDYYFLRSSFIPDDLDNLQNIKERTVFTPRNCPFDAHVQVELVVKQDGTTKPRFIYKSGRNEEETIAVDGNPFYLDMVYSQTSAGSKAYIGLDFGTSNTSIAFVDQSSTDVPQAVGRKVLE